MAKKITRKDFLVGCGRKVSQFLLGLTFFSQKVSAKTFSKEPEPNLKTPLPYILTLKNKLNLGMKKVISLTFDRRDWLYLGGKEEVKVFDENLQLKHQLKINNPAFSVALNDGGNLFIGHRTKITCYDLTGQKITAWGRKGKGRGEFNYITGMAIKGDFIYVADAGNRRINCFAVNGDFVDDMTGFIIPSGYFDCAFDKNGVLHVGHTGRHRIEKFNQNGEFIGAWGKQGMEPENFCGCCNPTNLSILSNGNVATTEKGIPRLKVYDASGKLLACAILRKIDEEALGADRIPDNSLWNIGQGQLNCHDGKVGMDLAINSKDQIALVDTATDSILFYKMKSS